MYKSNLTVESIGNALRSALSNGLIREDDTLVMFHDLSFLQERIHHLSSVFPSHTLHAVAMKANPLKRILEFIRLLGAGAEVASLAELKMALKAGYPAKKIVFDSPVKTWQELEFALTTGVHINIDSLAELERVAALKQRIVSGSTIGIRINPQVGVGTIAESSVAGEYSKFGVPVTTKRKELGDAFLTYPWLTGVHLHVGSQGCSMELLLSGIGVLYNFVSEINEKRTATGHELAYCTISSARSMKNERQPAMNPSPFSISEVDFLFLIWVIRSLFRWKIMLMQYATNFLNYSPFTTHFSLNLVVGCMSMPGGPSVAWNM